MAAHTAEPHYWETPEFLALQKASAEAFTEYCRVMDRDNYPTGHLSHVADLSYYRETVRPAKKHWLAARLRVNAARKAGAKAEEARRGN